VHSTSFFVLQEKSQINQSTEKNHILLDLHKGILADLKAEFPLHRGGGGFYLP
jgi:hypothetical protein